MTLGRPENSPGTVIMDDYSAGHITTAEAKELINSINRELGTDKIKFIAGISYRHLAVWKNGSDLPVQRRPTIS